MEIRKIQEVNQPKKYSLVKKVNRLKHILESSTKGKERDSPQQTSQAFHFPLLSGSKHRKQPSDPGAIKHLDYSGHQLDRSNSNSASKPKILKGMLKPSLGMYIPGSLSMLRGGNSFAGLQTLKNLPAASSLASLSKLDQSSQSIRQREPILDSNGEVTQKIQLAIEMVALGLQKLAEGDLEGLVIVLDEMEHSCLTYQARTLVSGFYQLYSCTLLDLGEYVKCVHTAKRLITDAEKLEDHASMLFCYEIAGEALTKLKYFEEALKCYFMMLKISLKLHKQNKELLAYDKIGMGYFHLNEMDKSEYFHRKMVEGKTEPLDSKLRNLQFNKQRAAQLELAMKTKPNSLDLVPDEDLNDLLSIFFEPMAVDPKYREFDEKRRIALMPTELFQQANRRVGNVKVYSNDNSLLSLVKSSSSRKPTNRPQATLAHLSANRSVNIFDAVSAQHSKHHFRFLKFGRDLKHTNKRRIKQCLVEYQEMLEDAITRVVNVTNFVLSKPSVTAITSLGMAFKQTAK